MDVNPSKSARHVRRILSRQPPTSKSAILVIDVVYFVENHPLEIDKIRCTVEHLAQDLGGDNQAGCGGIERNVTRQQPDILELILHTAEQSKDRAFPGSM